MTEQKPASGVMEIRKRDGRVVPFDLSRIENAVSKAFAATGEENIKAPEKVSKKVVSDILKLQKVSRDKKFLPTVEIIQDLVEEELMAQGFTKTAKAYILYRQKRTEMREEKGLVPQRVRDLADKSKSYFKNPLGEFVYYRSYSKWWSVENYG